MKAVLLSVKPKWCKLIFSGEKTIEARKTAPKLETPFKVYVYETLGKYKSCRRCAIWQTCPLRSPFGCSEGAGAVIGEFMCDFVEECIPDFDPYYQVFFNYFFESGNDCLTEKEIRKYGNGRNLYGLHITSPKLYDEPKELSEFYTLGNCEKYDFCNQCKNFHRGQGWLDGSYCDEDSCLDNTRIPVTRPPQSWQYVEGIDE